MGCTGKHKRLGCGTVPKEGRGGNMLPNNCARCYAFPLCPGHASVELGAVGWVTWEANSEMEFRRQNALLMKITFGAQDREKENEREFE